MKKTKRILALLLSMVVALGVWDVTAFADETETVVFDTVAEGGEEDSDIYQIISDGIGTSEAYLQNHLTELHQDGGVTYGFEWYIIAMLRAGKNIGADILEEYYASVSDKVKTWNSEVKPTDVSRTATALTVMGKDITDIDGVDLADLIYNSTRLTEGSNELAYALIALDAANVTIPEAAKWSRNAIITELLKFQAADGGFGLTDGNSSDVDMTAICLQALAPYQENETVKTATQEALVCLKDTISDDYNYSNNSMSTAQVLLALASLEIDITDSDNGFGGDYYNIITALDGYRNTDGDGYLYGDKVNPMATVQVMQAYDAYRKAHKEDILYWDFTTEGEGYDDKVPDSGSDSDDETADPATIYVTIASEGTVVTDKNGGYMAQAPVTVTDRNDDGILTVDEALYAAHEAYYQGGAEVGYSSYSGQYGLSLAVLWGKGTEGTTATAGYWLNNASCLSLEDAVTDGDYLTAFNYYDTAGWSDAYSCFTENETSVTGGSSVNLTLKYISGYDSETWEPVFSLCSGAKVVFLGSNNSVQKTLTTDDNGQVKISFSSASSEGSYYVMAYADNGSIVPAVCKINVTVAEGGGGSGGSSSGKITVYIRVADPKGTTYLKKTAYSVERGTSIYELLQKTGLDIDVTRSAYGVYVKSIEGLAEFDEGAESGWMYRVNGEFSDYSISLYSLSKGDYVELLYTRNLGEDVGDNSYTRSSSGTAKPKDETKTDEPIKDSEVQEKPSFSESTFADVKKDDWHYESVKYVYENNLMQGTGNGFSPDSNLTRAMLVTVLYRLENPEEKMYNNIFNDVADGEWYTDAVAWAAENGVVKGISETEFAPNDDITREQMAAIIYRYAELKGYDVTDSADISQYADVNEVSDWALDAIKWTNAAELVKGTSDTALSPQDTATRAQVATILMRFCELECRPNL